MLQYLSNSQQTKVTEKLMSQLWNFWINVKLCIQNKHSIRQVLIVSKIEALMLMLSLWLWMIPNNKSCPGLKNLRVFSGGTLSKCYPGTIRGEHRILCIRLHASSKSGKRLLKYECQSYRQLWRHREKAITFTYIFNCRKMSKKNARYYCRNY